MPESSFRYTWSPTWDNKAEDFVCNGGKVKVGRAYKVNSISDGRWIWVCYAIIGNLSAASFGASGDARQGVRSRRAGL